MGTTTADNRSHPGLNRAVFVLAAVLFLIGISNCFRYGRGWDEKTEQGILISNFNEYVFSLLDEDSALFWKIEGTDFFNYGRISDSIEKDHGIAMYYLFVPLLWFFRNSELTLMHLWHLYTYLIWFSGVIAVFFLMRETCRSPRVPAAGMLFYFFTPRIYAEGHYNNKDIVLLTLVLLMLLFAVRSMKYLKRRDVFLFSVFSGFLMNCKVIGIALWGLTGLFMLFYLLQKGLLKENRKNIRIVKAGIFLSCAFYALLTPAMWQDVPGYFRYVLVNATGFTRWLQQFLFNGEIVFPARDGIPWYYLPQWIVMSTPLYITVLFLCSCALFIFRALRYRRVFRDDREYLFLMILASFLIPFLYPVLSHRTMVLYNGWRHFYFLYAYMLIGTGYALDLLAERLEDQKTRKPAAAGICAVGICFLCTAGDMAVNRSLEYLYFNPVCRRIWDCSGFEGDYWNISVLPAAADFAAEEAESRPEGQISLALAGYSRGEKNETIINPDPGHLRFLEEDDPEAEYLLYNRSMLKDKSVLDGLETVFSVQVYGKDITVICRNPAAEQGS